ncbi:MAG: hypothetical protein GY708_11920 [Actinomycetia bacterium]|nr:hypothetical protein [Actinomycetes bacterium]
MMYVLEATGEGIGTHRGILTSQPDVFERLWARIGEEGPSGRESFTDRTGELHAGWADVEAFARAFAKAEPKVVIDLVDMQEAKLAAGGSEPGEKWQLDYLRELGPAFALVRQWVGVEEHRLAQEKELDRVRRLVWQAIWELRRLGHDAEAAKFERALHGS